MKQQSSSWVARGRRNTVNLMIWTFTWTFTMALATFGPKFLWPSNASITIMAVLLNLGLGIGMIIANKRYLKGLDEMYKKIQLEAMAITLGVGLVGGMGYTLLDITNLIASDAEISHLIILMSLTYLTAIMIGRLRYR